MTPAEQLEYSKMRLALNEAEIRSSHTVARVAELENELAEVRRTAEFNFEQYQDAGRLLHDECEKTERMLAALERAASWLEGWASAEPYLSDIRAAIASAKRQEGGASC